MPGGCSQSPLPGPKLIWRGGLWLDSKELTRLARSPQAKSRFHRLLIFPFYHRASFMI